MQLLKVIMPLVIQVIELSHLAKIPSQPTATTEKEYVLLKIILIEGPASIKAVPYQASISYSFGPMQMSTCGGTIVSERKIVTAAHCVLYDDGSQPRRYRSPEDFRVVVGISHLSTIENHTQQFLVERVVPHCAYKDGDPEVQHDIALLIVKGSIIMSESVQPLKLHTGELMDNLTCIIAGWGHLGNLEKAPQQLKIAQVYILDSSVCQYSSIRIPKTQICAGHGGSTCPGDSGGPLQCNGELVGVISQGSCGMAPGDIYTRVAAYIDFIRDEYCVSYTILIRKMSPSVKLLFILIWFEFIF